MDRSSNKLTFHYTYPDLGSKKKLVSGGTNVQTRPHSQLPLVK